MNPSENHEGYIRLSKLMILFFVIFMLIFVCLRPTVPMGESDDYMLSSISLERRLSLRMTEEDLEQARTDFPEHYEHLRNSWEAGHPSYLFMSEDNVYPWYFGTYSFLCLPMKKVLGLLGLSQSYAFVISNVLLLGAALCVVLFCLRQSAQIRALAVLLLMASPIIPYLLWPSAEVLLFSFIAVAVVFLLNGQHHAASLFVALSGTLNPSAMALGVAVIADYFWVMLLEENNIKSFREAVAVVARNWVDILKHAACYLPFLIVSVYNIVTFGYLFPQSMLGLNQTQGWLQRIWSTCLISTWAFCHICQVSCCCSSLCPFMA